MGTAVGILLKVKIIPLCGACTVRPRAHTGEQLGRSLCAGDLAAAQDELRLSSRRCSCERADAPIRVGENGIQVRLLYALPAALWPTFDIPKENVIMNSYNFRQEKNCDMLNLT